MSDTKPVFTQIATSRDSIIALDNEGGVWRYYAANKVKGTFAAWFKLTEYRVDNTGPRKLVDKPQTVVDGNI